MIADISKTVLINRKNLVKYLNVVYHVLFLDTFDCCKTCKSMNLKVLFAFLAVVLLFSCKKGVGGKQSNLSLSSVSTRSVLLNQTVTFNFEFSHPYSDGISDTLGIKINYKTCSYKKSDTTFMILPTFDNTANQICKLEYGYTFGGNGTFTSGCFDLRTGTTKSDSAYFQFWLIDRNSVSSDTISSPMIYLKRN